MKKHRIPNPTLAAPSFSALAILSAFVVGCGPPAETPEPQVLDPRGILEWNEAILAAAEEEDGFLTLKGLRTAAMMHIAIWDVIASTDPGLDPFFATPSASGADIQLTAASHRAAYDVAVASFPARSEQFGEIYRRATTRPLTPNSTDPSDQWGQALAAVVLGARNGDRWDADAEYTWHPMAPGVYAEFEEHSGTPEGFVFGAGWAQARPFVLPSADHFRAPPPPAIDSEDYAQAFDEVKELGAARSATRTDDQAHLAMWWKDFAENSHNRLARQLVVEHDLDGLTTALLFARLNIAIYDAYVGVFENKFHYNHWRPYTAIRWAEHDGNPTTQADPDWTNLHDHTYAFPSYPSAHGTACAAAMTVLGGTLGRDTPFIMTTTTVDRAGPFSGKVALEPPTRRFASFDEAAEECGLSRLYLGIHFRYDAEQGTALGRRIGRYVLEHAPDHARSP